MTDDPASFHIADSSINEISSDIGSHSFIIHCMSRQPPVDQFVEWIKVTWCNLATPNIDPLDFGFFLLRFTSVEDCSFVKQNGP